MQEPYVLSTVLLVIASALLGGFVAQALRLPLVAGYIGVGLVFGNVFPNLGDDALLAMISEVGITLLLFSVGVEFSFTTLRKVFPLVLRPALFQVFLTLGICFPCFILLGLNPLSSLLLAIAVSLSSTAIIVKTLGAAGGSDSYPGTLITGWLVIQDLSVIPLLILFLSISDAVMHGASGASVIGSLVYSIVKAGITLVFIVIAQAFIVPKVLAHIARLRNRELFGVTVISIVFLSGFLFHSLGLSAALGAFIAGLVIAETAQNHAVFSEIRPLRDVFAVIFFTSIGLSLRFIDVVPLIPRIAFFVAIALFVKSTITMFLLRISGHHRKSTFETTLYLLPMSEFGIVLATQAVTAGAVDKTTYTLVVAITLVTIVVCVPVLTHIHALYRRVHRGIGKNFPVFFAQKDRQIEEKEGYPIENHVVICGYGRVGKYVGRALEMANIPYLVVDYNSTAIEALKKKGIITVYGDPADIEVLDFAQVDLARALVIAIPDRHVQEMVIANALTLNRKIQLYCRTHHEEDQKYLKTLGVQTIIQPEFEASLAVIEKILPDYHIPETEIAGKISRLKIEHGLS